MTVLERFFSMTLGRPLMTVTTAEVARGVELAMAERTILVEATFHRYCSKMLLRLSAKCHWSKAIACLPLQPTSLCLAYAFLVLTTGSTPLKHRQQAEGGGFKMV